jgi:hypothetical protein
MNTPITTLTSLSALCEDYGRTAGERDDASSLPRMEVDAFRAWLQRAEPGACLEYHRGLLSLDRSLESDLSENRRRALSRVADLAFDAANRGQVHLVQRRNGDLDFSYLAIKASQASHRLAAFAAPLAQRPAAPAVPEGLAA